MVKVWKAFHCEIDVGLSTIWEVLGLRRTRVLLGWWASCWVACIAGYLVVFGVSEPPWGVCGGGVGQLVVVWFGFFVVCFLFSYCLLVCFFSLLQRGLCS